MSAINTQILKHKSIHGSHRIHTANWIQHVLLEYLTWS